MANPETSLPNLLSSLITSLQSAVESVPKADRLQPPNEAQSLLTTKNELFLSYVQNLVFLIVLKLRHFGTTVSGPQDESASLKELHKEVVEKLVELRLYLDKGVKPLESRLTYQIDRVIRAAEESNRKDVPKAKTNGHKRVQNGTSHSNDSDEESGSGSGGSESESESDTERLDALRPAGSKDLRSLKSQENTTSNDKSGVYVPPRIKPTAFPLSTTEQSESRKRAKVAKSSTLDEFVDTELLATPVAEPSIGSTIREGGQRTMTRRERQEDEEKRRYEEDNFVRLTGLSQKERKKQPTSRKRADFGGEEWGELNQAVDRIHGLTKRREGGQLERSRKRGAGMASNGGDFGMGDKFAKRKRML